MSDIDELVQKFKEKIIETEKNEQFKESVVNPLAERVFAKNFLGVFKELALKINEKIGFKVITFLQDNKNRFSVSGQYHRIHFQKCNVEIIENIITVSIIPLYVWKGVSKHFEPISFFINLHDESVSWDIPEGSVDKYCKNLFMKFIEDIDFSM
ncbi:MAG: hypothetical protein PHV68_07735 [Candidatus Gastranaerophilales bacterium]|nr:hypothetical protein [Candidatus Gastranaerophilales bacterium]